MNSKSFRYIIYFCLFLMLIIFSYLFYEVISKQKEIIQYQNELRQLFINSQIAKTNINLKSLTELVSNQNYIKDLWWNTIINQSGLSIIFAVIVLFVGLTFSYITKLQFNEIHENKIKELDQKISGISKDIQIIFSKHIEDIGMSGMTWGGPKIENQVHRLNSFAEIDTLNRENFSYLYKIDIEELSHTIYDDLRVNYSNHKIHKETHPEKFDTNITTLIYKIEDKIDRVALINSLLDLNSKISKKIKPDSEETLDEKEEWHHELENYLKKFLK